MPMAWLTLGSGRDRSVMVGALLMNIIGGRSSTYQFAEISTRSMAGPRSRGFIQDEAGWLVSIFVQESPVRA